MGQFVSKLNKDKDKGEREEERVLLIKEMRDILMKMNLPIEDQWPYEKTGQEVFLAVDDLRGDTFTTGSVVALIAMKGYH